MHKASAYVLPVPNALGNGHLPCLGGDNVGGPSRWWDVARREWGGGGGGGEPKGVGEGLKVVSYSRLAGRSLC